MVLKRNYAVDVITKEIKKNPNSIVLNRYEYVVNFTVDFSNFRENIHENSINVHL